MLAKRLANGSDVCQSADVLAASIRSFRLRPLTPFRPESRFYERFALAEGSGPCAAETSSNSSQHLNVSVQELASAEQKWDKRMKNTKFIVKIDRGSTHAPEYVQHRTPIQMTSDRKLALLTGRLTAEDAVKLIQTLQCTPELVSVRVND